MNKLGSSKAKRTIFTITGLGFIVLGLGAICFALMNIVPLKAETINTYTTHPGSSSAPTAPEQEALRSAVGSTEPTEEGQQSDTPVSGENLYPLYPSVGDVIGSLSIPAIELEVPIIQGTGTDELKEGAGHFLQSVLPGEEDNCVISGHRDTFFAHLGELEIGDQLMIQTSAGTFTYDVSGTRIVDKDDKTVIVPTDHAVLTLTTCYPFNYVGPAPERYIVSADLTVSE